MIKQGDTLRLSASDLVGHLNCRHLTDLDVEATNGRIERPHFHDPLLDILVERGAIHERNYLEHLAGKGYEVVEVEGTGVSQPLADRTLHAMRSGAQVIAQAALLHDAWGGRADLLLRVPTPSALGDWSYEVIDTKLARETRGGTILQLSLYSDLLSLAQGVNPAHMHVVTPGSGFEPESYRTAAFAAYYRYVRRRLERSLAERTGIGTYPDPNEHCEICRWRVTCDTRRRRDDHLCLVAGISKVQTDELVQPRHRHRGGARPPAAAAAVEARGAARHIPTNGSANRRACRCRAGKRIGRSSRRCHRRRASASPGCPRHPRATSSSISRAIRSSARVASSICSATSRSRPEGKRITSRSGRSRATTRSARSSISSSS